MMEMEAIGISKAFVPIAMLSTWLVTHGVKAIKIRSVNYDGQMAFILSVDKDSFNEYSDIHPYQEINPQRRLNVVRNV